MKKLNTLIVLSVILWTAPLLTKAQCKFEHRLKVENAKEAGVGGKILVSTAEKSVEFKIYAEKNGAINLIETKKVAFANSKTPIAIFESLKPGKYHVLAEWNGCKSGVGGIEGITIN